MTDTTSHEPEALDGEDAAQAAEFIEYGYRNPETGAVSWADSDGELDNLHGPGFLAARFRCDPSEKQVLALHESALRGARALVRRTIVSEPVPHPAGMTGTFTGILVGEVPVEVDGEKFRQITLRVPA